MKKYTCVPGSRFLPIIFTLGIGFYSWMIWECVKKDEYVCILFFVAWIIAILLFIIITWGRTMRSVTIKETQIVCSAVFLKDIIIDYADCNVGMAYHIQSGRKIWWIYLYYGSLPWFKGGINSVKCQDGFVKMMYRKDIYEELIRVLPKKQRTNLISAYRCSGLGDWL